MNELVRWDPFRAALPFEGSLFDMVPTLFRPIARQAWAGPKMDVTETENAYQLAVELPGIPKDAIQVSVNDNTVAVTAEGSEEKAQGAEEQNWLLRERSFGWTTDRRKRAIPTACSTSRCRRSARASA